jgi:hypothetical protein
MIDMLHFFLVYMKCTLVISSEIPIGFLFYQIKIFLFLLDDIILMFFDMLEGS